MGMRKYEREVVRNRCIKRDGDAKAFPEEWKKYRNEKNKARIEQKHKDGKITSIRNRNVKKKQRHYDDGRAALRQIRMMKQFFANMKKQAAENKSEKAD